MAEKLFKEYFKLQSLQSILASAGANVSSKPSWKLMEGGADAKLLKWARILAAEWE